jgi:ElaB/YqjD/DUF883 family membrane-anchored ribosome-binding protein
MAAADEKQDAVRALHDEVARLRADIAALGRDLRNLGAAAAGTATHAAESGSERLKADMDEAMSTLRRRGEEALRDAKASVEERPLFAALVALAVGFVLGRILDRR